MNGEAVRFEDVSVLMDGTAVLDGHSFCIGERDFLGIIGPNGGGKTTLLKVILGLVRPTTGRVTVFGRDPAHSRFEIGYVPQASQFDREFPLDVREVVLMGRMNRRRPFERFTQEDRAAADEVLRQVDMFDQKDRMIGRLSGGERQRVLIARALAGGPRLLLLDEPTASVDPRMQMGIYELLGRLKERMAIILVTHDVGVIASYVDKIACLNVQIHYHDTKEITAQDLEAVYHCPVEMIAHGIPHRVLKQHEGPS